MFENYYNISTSYTPCNVSVPSQDCTKATRPFEEYDARGRLVGYSWRCGDTVVLEFITDGDITIEDEEVYTDAETYLDGKFLKLTIYNFRYEPVYTATQPAEVVCKFILDSSSKLARGTYRCALLLMDNKNNIDTTLVKPEDYTLTIK